MVIAMTLSRWLFCIADALLTVFSDRMRTPPRRPPPASIAYMALSDTASKYPFMAGTAESSSRGSTRTSSMPRESAVLSIRWGLTGDLTARKPRDSWLSANRPTGLANLLNDMGFSGATRCRCSGGHPI
jgi:hypothetical protein